MSRTLMPSDCQERRPDVLIVACELFLRKLLRRQLEGLGCLVREAVSVDRALARIGDSLPDLVLLDATLQHGDGASILGSLRARSDTRDLPVLLLTADPRSPRTTEAIALGALAAIPVHRAAAIGPWIEAALPALREPDAADASDAWFDTTGGGD
jgi:CheY-like chemotaxis protein